MSRPLRLEFPGALYHVMARGNARQEIYLDDRDRRDFLSLYAEVAGRLNWLCHAYCLMANHYHFLIETPEPNLSEGMRQLNSTYAQYFNRRHERVGHLFQGRFNAVLVQRDAHLLELARYVVLNPQRAGLVRRPGHWSWSSYRPTAGLCPRPPWLTTDWLLSQLAHARASAHQAYESFVTNGMKAETPWTHLQGQIYLGDRTFAEQLKRTIKKSSEELREVPRPQRTPRKSLAVLKREARDPTTAMFLAHYFCAYSLKEIAYHFGLHYSTVSKRIKRIKESARLT